MKRSLFFITYIGLASIFVLPISYKSWAQTVPNSSIKVDSSLGLESSHLETKNKETIISGGAERGTSVFHSFEKFDILTGESAYFKPNAGIDNIITRVTGQRGSNISGTLGVKDSSANLFFINPNGIEFGDSARLDLGGSFFASTANSLIFDNNFEFSASESRTPPEFLKISLPIGIRFGENPGSIQSSSDSLQVSQSNTIGLIGGQVLIHGKISAPGGKIEVGSVTGESLVKFNSSSDWTFDYQNIIGHQDIFLKRAFITTTDENSGSSGNISFSGRNIKIETSSIDAFNGSKDESSIGGDISLNASDSLTINFSEVITSGTSESFGKLGDIIIKTKQLDVYSSFIDGSNFSQKGKSGNITIIAADSIIEGSQITSQSFSEGNAGDVNLTTSKLILRNGGQISASSVSSAGIGGNINITASKSIDITGENQDFGTSGIFSRSNNESVGDAGNITIATDELNINDGGKISVKSEGLGSAGNIEINAKRIFLNRGSIEADTKGIQGNISIFNAEKLVLANNSLISTNATNSANGGNIIINASILLALPPTGSKGSDIVAKAETGDGGNITINSQGIFGIENRPAIPEENRTNDIDASSQFGASGQVQINTSTDVNRGLIELPTTVLDPNTIISQQPCDRRWNSSFTLNGRGGTPPTPQQDLSPEAVQVGLVEAIPTQQQGAIKPQVAPATSTVMQKFIESPIVPAQGWVYNTKQQVVLVAYNPTLTAQQRLQQNPVCTATE